MSRRPGDEYRTLRALADQLSRGQCARIGAPCDRTTSEMRDYAFALLVDRVVLDGLPIDSAVAIARAVMTP